MIITIKHLYKIKKKQTNKAKEERRKEVKKNPKREETLSVQVRKRIQEEEFLYWICWFHNLL